MKNLKEKLLYSQFVKNPLPLNFKTLKTKIRLPQKKFSQFLIPILSPFRSPSSTPANSKNIQLYDANNIDSLNWSEYEEGDYLQRFWMPLVKKGISHYISNIQTEVKMITVDNLVLPLTINNEEYENSYVCSPYSYYISYALESITMMKNPIAKQMLKGLVKGLAKILQWGQINKVITVNNWPFSTNIYPKLSEQMMAKLIAYLKQRFPQHAIVFRSIDAYTNKSGYEALEKNQFKFIASRQIYLTDTKQDFIFETRLFKSDMRLLKKSDYEILEAKDLLPEDLPRILALYQAVYINKYSSLNPNLNQNFVEFALKNEWLHFKALKKNGQIDGVVGYFCRQGILMSPFFGYDTSKPQDTGLYRLLSTLLILEARQKKLIFHQSSGASFYKKVRKADDYLEFTAVYTQHLSYSRKLPWSLLRMILNSIGIPFIKNY